jgi:hypothetical protein
MATHFAVVLGAWRLRVRIDVDEPRESEFDDERTVSREHAAQAGHQLPHVATWGRG